MLLILLISYRRLKTYFNRVNRSKNDLVHLKGVAELLSLNDATLIFLASESVGRPRFGAGILILSPGSPCKANPEKYISLRKSGLRSVCQNLQVKFNLAVV